MRRNIFGLVLAAALVAAMVVAVFSVSTAAAHTGHTSCEGGVPAAAAEFGLPVPGDGAAVGEFISDWALFNDGFSSAVETWHSSGALCEQPAP